MKTINKNLADLPLNELRGVGGGGFWEDLGNAVGRICAGIANDLDRRNPADMQRQIDKLDIKL